MTQSPGSLILAILASGLFFVLLPVLLLTFSEFRRKKTVICPHAGCATEVGVDTGRAMRSAAFGRVSLRVTECSLWPARKGCDQSCMRASQPAELPV